MSDIVSDTLEYYAAQPAANGFVSVPQRVADDAVSRLAALRQKLEEAERANKRTISVDIGSAVVALQNSPELASMIMELVAPTAAKVIEAAESRATALEAENAALIHDNARYVDTAAALATENERLRAENARLKDDLAKMTGLATSFLCDEIDYMLVNKLGDPEQQHNIRWARELGITVFSHAALTGDPAKPEGDA